MEVPDRHSLFVALGRGLEVTWISDGNANLKDWPWRRSPPILVCDVGVCHGARAVALFL